MAIVKYTSPDTLAEIYCDNDRLPGFSWCTIRSYNDTSQDIWAEWKQWMPADIVAAAETAALANGWSKETL